MTLEKKKAAILELCQYGDSIKANKTIAASVISKRLNYVPCKKLYKFRTCTDRNFKTLEENCVWMSSASSFPDLFDCTINIDILKNRKEIEDWLHSRYPVLCYDLSKHLFEERGLSIPYTHADFTEYVQTCLDRDGNPIAEKETAFLKKHASPEELSQMDYILQQVNVLQSRFAQIEDRVYEGIVEAINLTRTRTRDSMLVYCMTERKDNPVFWENYADNYKGFCVEYDFSEFERFPFEDYKNLVYLLPMTYRKTKPYFNFVPFLDGAIRESITKDPTWQRDPDLNTELNMQLYYKSKDYEYEHEWRFAIKNEGNNEQRFPFVHAIFTGKDINQTNLSKLCLIADRLSIPIYQQIINKSKNGFEYVLMK
jgi:Protein of unknown function (DUF2971).